MQLGKKKLAAGGLAIVLSLQLMGWRHFQRKVRKTG